MKITKNELKEMVQSAIEPYLVVERPKHLFDNDNENKEFSYIDDKGNVYKAYSFNEPMQKELSEGMRKDSFGRILRAFIIGNRSDLSYEEEKALSEGLGSSGGWLVPEEVSAQVYDRARNIACVQKAGAKTIEMPTPQLRLVKVTGDPTAYFVAENSEITESEWTIEPINLKAMTLGVRIKSSLELLEDAENAGSAIQNGIAQAIALKTDLVALSGNGTNEPRGLAHDDDVNVYDLSGAISDYDPFSYACEYISDDNGVAGAVIMPPCVFYKLDRLKEGTTNGPLAPPESFKNLKKFITNQIDASGSDTKAFVGDYSQLLFGIRKSLEIETARSGDDTFKKGQVQIRGRMRFDIAILRPKHFTMIDGITV